MSIASALPGVTVALILTLPLPRCPRFYHDAGFMLLRLGRTPQPGCELAPFPKVWRLCPTVDRGDCGV
jgi:hypothetical protein